jgi:hypothetical protein
MAKRTSEVSQASSSDKVKDNNLNIIILCASESSITYTLYGLHNYRPDERRLSYM